jgi:hypothetical protein
VPFKRPPQFGMRQFLTDEEYSKRLEDAWIRDERDLGARRRSLRKGGRTECADTALARVQHDLPSHLPRDRSSEWTTPSANTDGQSGSRAALWPIYFFISVAFWNLVGAGLFGFMINPPIALSYMQGLNTTLVRRHAAVFGVQMLGIGLMLFSLRTLDPVAEWKNGLVIRRRRRWRSPLKGVRRFAEEGV